MGTWLKRCSACDGGAGASYREAAAAAEVLGSFVTPIPFLGSAVVATAALLSVASGASRGVASGDSAVTSSGTPFTPAKAAADLLRRMADGGVTTALAVPFATAPGSAFPASIRVAALGAMAMAVTAGVGRLFGAVV